MKSFDTLESANWIFQAYDILKRGVGLSDAEMADVFDRWNNGVLDSFLIEITRDVLRFKDDDGSPLVEKILDSAGQKGTGKWTAINALDLGMPVTLIGEAVFARCLSSIKDERGRASKILGGPKPQFSGDKQAFIDNLEQALYASKIVSYCQGFMLIQDVSLSSPLGILSLFMRLTVLLLRRLNNTNGSSINLLLHLCGVEVASFGLFS